MGNTVSSPVWDNNFAAQMKVLTDENGGVEISHQGKMLQAFYPPGSHGKDFTQVFYEGNNEFKETTLHFLDLSAQTAAELNQDSRPGSNQFPVGLSFYRRDGSNFVPIPPGTQLKAFK